MKLTIAQATTTRQTVCVTYRNDNGQVKIERGMLSKQIDTLLLNGTTTIKRSQLIAINS